MKGRTVKSLEKEIKRAKLVTGHMDNYGKIVIKVLDVILEQSAKK